MPDLASVIPALRFTATIEYYLIKIFDPRKNFFEKLSCQNPPFGP